MKQHQQDLFLSIYHATYKPISKYVFFNTAQLADAEDLIQNIYSHYFHSVIQKEKVIENPQTYLMIMAKNELALYYKDKATQAIQLIDPKPDVFENIPDENDFTLKIFDQFTIDQITQAIENLPVLDQKILGGHLRYELTFAEVATQLDLSENTIKTRYYRAIKTLKTKLIRINE